MAPFPRDTALRPDLQHSMGLDAACREMIRPLGSGTCTRNTRRTRVFFLPMSVSPFRSSMSAFRSFRMPAQSMLHGGEPRHKNRFTEQKRSPTNPPKVANQTHSPNSHRGIAHPHPRGIITRTKRPNFYKEKEKSFTGYLDHLLSGDCFSREMFLMEASTLKSTRRAGRTGQSYSTHIRVLRSLEFNK